LATFDEYAPTSTRLHRAANCEQLPLDDRPREESTAAGRRVVDGDTNFVPLVVIPDIGVRPGSSPTSTSSNAAEDVDTCSRSCIALGLITVSDVQLLEGMADFAKSYRRASRDRNMMKLLRRWASARSLAEGDRRCKFLARRGFPAAAQRSTSSATAAG